jgi:malonate-semialdehyde dehydrogenase (acetylating)/methylmalonate-semialdehyde dehydrogenase
LAIKDISHFIDGACIRGRSGRSAPVFNPASGQQTGAVALASIEEVASAVAAAKRAFPSWADAPPLRRARILNRFLRIVEDRINELAAVITTEHGKVLSDAKDEVQDGPEVVELTLGTPQLPSVMNIGMRT